MIFKKTWWLLPTIVAKPLQIEPGETVNFYQKIQPHDK